MTELISAGSLGGLVFKARGRALARVQLIHGTWYGVAK